MVCVCSARWCVHQQILYWFACLGGEAFFAHMWIGLCDPTRALVSTWQQYLQCVNRVFSNYANLL